MEEWSTFDFFCIKILFGINDEFDGIGGGKADQEGSLVSEEY